MISAFLTDLIRAIHELFSPRLLTPDECRLNIPAWDDRPNAPAVEPPKIVSTAKTVDSTVIWSDTSILPPGDSPFTAEMWGLILDRKICGTRGHTKATHVKLLLDDGFTPKIAAERATMLAGETVTEDFANKIRAVLSYFDRGSIGE